MNNWAISGEGGGWGGVVAMLQINNGLNIGQR